MKPQPSIGRLVAGLFPAAEAPASPPAVPPARAKKLWDLEHQHHCPIIGTCLNPDELLKLARRHDFAGERADEFSLHVEAARRAGTRNPVAEALHKHLDRKYAGHLQRYSAARGDAEVLAQWRADLARGEVAGPLWAALTHKAASAATRQAIYADIHMLSHQVGAGQAADSRRLGYLEKENGELRRSLDRERRERGEAEAALQAHRQTLPAVPRRRRLQLRARPRPSRQRPRQHRKRVGIVICFLDHRHEKYSFELPPLFVQTVVEAVQQPTRSKS